MAVLVTGGAGFIGANFIHRLLDQTHSEQVINFDLLTYAGNLSNLADMHADPRYHFIRGDIADAAAVERAFNDFQIDKVVNFAAESHVDRSIMDPTPFARTNVVGVSVLLNAARQHHVSRFVQVSTDEVYGPTPDGQAFDERATLNPTSPYAATKAAADLLVLADYKTYGTDVCITRSANNYGPFQFPEKLIPLMATHTLRGKPLPVYGQGSEIRDWLHVGDNCAAIQAVMEHGTAGQIYNIAGHQYHSNLNIVKRIAAQLAAYQPRIEFISDRPGNDRQYVINDQKVRHDLGWRPEMMFETGIGDTIDWYVVNQSWWQPLVSKVKNRSSK